MKQTLAMPKLSRAARRHDVAPIQWLALSALAIAAIYLQVFDVSFISPDTEAVKFITTHYLGPLFILPMLSVTALLWGHKTKPTLSMATQFIAILFIVVIHFNLKTWAIVISHANYDLAYYLIDTKLSTTIRWMITISHLFHFDDISAVGGYHSVFIAMFFICYFIAARAGRIEEAIFGSSFLLLFGGVAYALFPAVGPFAIDDIGPASPPQAIMLHYHNNLMTQGMSAYRASLFTSAPAAMPSLHAAHAIYFSLIAAHIDKRWSLLFLPFLFYLLIEAVALRWHYLIDLVVGAGLAMATHQLCMRLHPSAPLQTNR